MKKIILPILIAVLFLGTAISPFLSANITGEDFGFEYQDTISLSENGTASREYKDQKYTLEISTNLTEENYTVWLVRLSPFRHINLGTLENGNLKYIETNPQIDYKTFTEIIITLESDPATTIPSDEHIIEGTFNLITQE